MTEQVLRDGVRIPHTDNLSTEIQGFLKDRGYQVDVSSKVSIRNTAKLISLDVKNLKLNARIYGVYEQTEQ